MSDEKQAKTKHTTKADLPEVSAEALPEPVTALPLPMPRPQMTGAETFLASYRATLASIGEAQAAVASDVTAMALEVSGMARANLTSAGDSVTALLGARNFADAVEIQLGFVRRSLDMLAGGSTRLGEIGLRLASDAAKPVTRPFTAG
jgi:hypothetical protein